MRRFRHPVAVVLIVSGCFTVGRSADAAPLKPKQASVAQVAALVTTARPTILEYGTTLETTCSPENIATGLCGMNADIFRFTGSLLKLRSSLQLADDRRRSNRAHYIGEIPKQLGPLVEATTGALGASYDHYTKFSNCLIVNPGGCQEEGGSARASWAEVQSVLSEWDPIVEAAAAEDRQRVDRAIDELIEATNRIRNLADVGQAGGAVQRSVQQYHHAADIVTALPAVGTVPSDVLNTFSATLQQTATALLAQLRCSREHPSLARCGDESDRVHAVLIRLALATYAIAPYGSRSSDEISALLA